MRSRLVRRAFALWIPSAVAVTLLSAMAYAFAQQNYRQSANDPQLQMAEDAAARLSAGGSPQEFATGPTVDMATSLALYLIVFDSSGKPLASSAVLDGATPVPPSGWVATLLAAALASIVAVFLWSAASP